LSLSVGQLTGLKLIGAVGMEAARALAGAAPMAHISARGSPFATELVDDRYG
jgi:hypothetical protein